MLLSEEHNGELAWLMISPFENTTRLNVNTFCPKQNKFVWPSLY